jgi:hypothetical protein
MAANADEIGSETTRVARAKNKKPIALIPCYEYATYIIRGPKATYIVHVQGANMQEPP